MGKRIGCVPLFCACLQLISIQLVPSYQPSCYFSFCVLVAQKGGKEDGTETMKVSAESGGREKRRERRERERDADERSEFRNISLVAKSEDKTRPDRWETRNGKQAIH
jgi:hypothetical protein